MFSNRSSGQLWGLYSLTLMLCLLAGVAHAQQCEIRVMPLGDSITRGVGSTPIDALNGYRDELYTTLIADGASVVNTYTVDFVGGEVDGSGSFDVDHEGHGGWNSGEVADAVSGWLSVNPPDVILLHIGTNSLTTDTTQTERILEEIDRFNPAIRVILARIIDWANTSSVVTTYNNNLETMAQQRITNGDLITVVDMQSALIYPDDMEYMNDPTDLLHPRDSGYAKMSGVWFNALSPMLQDLCGAPTILSAPVTSITISDSYAYDVRAVGQPTLSYSLVQAPTGMTIDPASGLIDWQPTGVDTFPVTVQASNGLGSTTQSFDLEVTDDVIVDNNYPGASGIGNWRVSSAPEWYGDDSLYSDWSEDSFSFSASIADQREVFLWWTVLSNRSNNVTVEIYDDTTLLDTHSVDQTSNGGQWNSLGVYDFSTSARVVILSSGSLKTTSADAVRFAQVSETAPSITSVPTTQAMLGVPYSYDVDADGYPAPGYSLIQAPVDMSIDPVTGEISWTPTSAGTVDVTVVANNGVAPQASQSFSIGVSDFGSDIIIDNTDSTRTTTTGSWLPSSASGFYGTDSVYSKSPGDSFRYDQPLSGSFEVYLWWTEFSNRATEVPVTILDGSTELATLMVNQRADGGQWNLLGTYDFSGNAAVVITVPGGSDSVVADALRFIAATPTAPAITSSAVTSAIEGQAYSYQVVATGTTPMTFQLLSAPAGMSIDPDTGVIDWLPGVIGTFPVEVEASNSLGSDIQNFSVTVETAPSGEPPVFTSSPVTSAIAAQAYSYDADATGSPTPEYGLSQGPAGMTVDQLSGMVDWPTPVVGSHPVTILASNDSGSETQSFTLVVSEDNSVREPRSIIDNGYPGTSAEGNWIPSGASGYYGTESLYSKGAGDVYSFESSLSGAMEVYLWWTEYANRSSAVEVRLYDGGNLLDTMTVNQQQDGGQWNLFQGSAGPVYTFSNWVRVEVHASGGSSTAADAVKLVPVVSGVPIITSTAPSTASVGEQYRYQLSVQGDTPLSFSLLEAPVGMSIDSVGEILWTPDTTDSFAVEVQAENANGTDSQSFSVQVTDPSSAVILDNGDTGTTATGNWLVSGANGAYGADSVYTKTLGDSYSYEVALSGQYEVQLWWTEFSNRADQVPVDIHHLDANQQPTVTTIYVNQRSNGGQWNSLGSYTFGGVARVVINGVGGDSVAADAVQFLP